MSDAPPWRWKASFVASPWPHLIVDNFLPRALVEKSNADIKASTSGFEIEARGRAQIEYSLLRSEALWKAIYSRRTIHLLSSAFAGVVALNRENWIQLRRMNSQTPEFPRHHDFVRNEDSIASFLYLSEQWTQENGGRLHLFMDGDYTSPTISIAPIQNRFVAFQTKACHWHSVEKVNGWERLSVLALWNFTPANAALSP